MENGKRTNEDLSYIKIKLVEVYDEDKQIYTIAKRKGKTYFSAKPLFDYEDIAFSHSVDEIVRLLYDMERWETHSTDIETIDGVVNMCNALSKADMVMDDVLGAFEPFVKVVHYITYKNQERFIYKDGDKEYIYSRATGICENASEKNVDIYARHCLGLEPLNKLGLDKVLIDGKLGIIDNRQSLIEQAQVFRAFRNKRLHGGVKNNDNWGTDIKGIDDGYGFGYVINSVIVLLVSILDYRFDLIYRFINPKIKNLNDDVLLAITPEQLEDKVIDYLKSEYIQDLQNEKDELGGNPYMQLSIVSADHLLEVNADNILPETHPADNNEEESLDDESADNVGTERDAMDLEEVIRDPANCRMILCGPSGAGKSTTTTHFMKLFAEEWANNHESLFPIRFNLKSYRENMNFAEICMPKTKAGKVINDTMKNAEIAYIEKKFRDGQVLLFLDGLNEVPSSHRKDLIEALKSMFCKKYPKQGFILTTRYEEVKDSLPKIAQIANEDFAVHCFALSPLSKNQIEDFTKKKFESVNDGNETGIRIWQYIQESETLRVMAQNPLQLKLITDILNSNLHIDTATLNRATLYSKYIEEMIKRELKQKDYDDSIIRTKINKFKYNVGFLALSVFEGGNNTVNALDINSEVLSMAKKLGFLQETTENFVAFTHDSYKSFFGAYNMFTNMQSEEQIRTYIEKYVVNKEQIELLSMLIGLEIGHHNLALILRIYLELKKDEKSEINPGLYDLAQIISEMPQTTIPIKWKAMGNGMEKSQMTLNSLFDAIVLNLMCQFRQKYEENGNKFDTESLFRILELIGRSASPLLIEELMKPFWLMFWGVKKEDIDKKGGCAPEAMKATPMLTTVFARHLLYNLSHIEHFHEKFFEMCCDMQLLGLKSSVSLNYKNISSIWQSLDDQELGFIANHLEKNTGIIPFATEYAIKAHMLMEDPSWIDAPIVVESADEINSGINVRIITKQFRNIASNNEYSAKIFRYIFNVLSRQKGGSLLLMNLMRRLSLQGLYRQEITDYIIQHNILTTNGRQILDQYPLWTYSEENLKAMALKPDVVRLTKDSLDEQGAKLPYIVSGVLKEEIKLIIPDINTDFMSKKLLLPLCSNSIQAKQYQEFEVVKDETMEAKETRIGIERLDGLRIPLPIASAYSWTDDDGNERRHEYLAQASTMKGLRLQLYSVNSKSIRRAMEKGTLLYIDGIECRFAFVKDAEQSQHLRVITLKRKENMPLQSNFAHIVDETGKTLMRLDNSLRTPVNYCLKYFRNAAINQPLSERPAYYAVFGYTVNSIMLWTEMRNFKNSAKIMLNGNKKALFAITKTVEFQDTFVEFHLSGNSAFNPPMTGTLTRSRNSSSGNQLKLIPYVYAYKSNDHIVVRISDEKIVKLLKQDQQLVNNLIYGETYRIGSVPFNIAVINFISQTPNAICLSLRRLDDQIIPSHGTICYAPNTKLSEPTKFLQGTRMPFTVIDKMKCVGRDEKGHAILETSDLKNYHNMPSKMFLHLPFLQRVLQAYRLKNDGDDGKRVVRIAVDDGKRCFAEGANVKNLELMNYCPVCNTSEHDMFKRDKSYVVDNAYCTLVNNIPRIVRFPAPKNNIVGAYYKIDNNRMCIVKAGELKKIEDRSLYYALYELEITNDIHITEGKGTIRFFFDSEGLYPMPLEYGLLLTQIELDNIKAYHHDTCRIMFDECKGAGYFSDLACKMLIEHSCSSMLLDEFLSDSINIRKKKYPNTLKFNICTVIKRSVGELQLYSSELFKIVNSPDIDSGVEHGNLVLLEKSGKIIPLKAPKPLPQLGYLIGIVVRVSDKKHDVHIHVKGVKSDFFWHYPEDMSIKLGDVLTFMPSVNNKDLESPIATRVEYKRSEVKEGIVVDKMTKTTYDGKLVKVVVVEDCNDRNIKGSLRAYENDYMALKKIDSVGISDKVGYFFRDIYYDPSNNKPQSIFIV